MSKAVKAVGKVFKSVGKVVKKFIKSDLFKTVVIAAAVYFGGAGISSMMNGGTFMGGVSSAGASLSQASTLAGAGNWGQAASTIGNAWGTAYTAGGGTAAVTSGTGLGLQTATTNIPQLTQLPLGAPGAGGMGSMSGNIGGLTGPQTVAQAAPTLGPPGGMFGSGTAKGVGANVVANAGEAALSEAIITHAWIAGGTVLAGGALDAYGQYKMQKDLEDQEKRRLKNNSWFGMDQNGNRMSMGRDDVPTLKDGEPVASPIYETAMQGVPPVNGLLRPYGAPLIPSVGNPTNNAFLTNNTPGSLDELIRQQDQGA